MTGYSFIVPAARKTQLPSASPRSITSIYNFVGPGWTEKILDRALELRAVQFQASTDHVLWLRHLKFLIEDGSSEGRTLICPIHSAWLQENDSLIFKFLDTYRVRSIGFFARGDARRVELFGVDARTLRGMEDEPPLSQMH